MPTLLADAELVLVAHLTALLTNRAESYTTGVTVSVSAPTTETGSPTPPHVQVEDDGTPNPRWPITNPATVRVTCWAAGRTSAKQLGALAQALLGAAACPDGAWSVHQLTGPLRGFDTTTELHFASFTYRVGTRPA